MSTTGQGYSSAPAVHGLKEEHARCNGWRVRVGQPIAGAGGLHWEVVCLRGGGKGLGTGACKLWQII